MLTDAMKKEFEDFWGLAFDLLDYEEKQIGADAIGPMNYIVACTFAAMMWERTRKEAK